MSVGNSFCFPFGFVLGFLQRFEVIQRSVLSCLFCMIYQIFYLIRFFKIVYVFGYVF